MHSACSIVLEPLAHCTVLTTHNHALPSTTSPVEHTLAGRFWQPCFVLACIIQPCMDSSSAMCAHAMK